MRSLPLAASFIFLAASSPLLAQDNTTPVASKPAKAAPKPAPVKKVPTPEPTPLPTVASDPTPLPTPAPVAPPAAKLQDKFYGNIGVPMLFTYNTYPAIDPIVNGGRSSDAPDGTWTSGLGINVGFEKAINPHLSALLEMGLMTIDTNQLLVSSNDFPPSKTGAVLLNLLVGLKFNAGPEKPVNPYFSVGMGCSSIRISSMVIPSLLVIVPEYQGLRFLAQGAAGLDIRCDEELTAFIECQFDDMDTLHIFAHGPDLNMCLFKSGLRMAL